MRSTRSIPLAARPLLPPLIALATAVATLALLAILAGCSDAPGSGEAGVTVDYERYELDNGLDVVLHVDRSDPVAAVAMTFHVGSAREVEGRTGFAHMFEHLFFLDSENLGPGGLDRLMTRVGGSTNGTTNRDRTNYFEVVPIDGLEKTLWAEADKLGFFINTVTQDVVDKERQVVKNEKRQSYDNQPYGHTSFVIDRALYPEGHPYRWQVIGSLADLDAASLEDVRSFHARWYGPNNATLVVAGDLDVDRTKEWIERYFGEIPAVETPEVATPPEVRLAESQRLVHEDNFANLPELTLSWPTVPLYHPDQYALDVLADLLAEGKSAPLYEVLVEEAQLAPAVTMSHASQELASRLTLRVRAFPGTDLDDVLAHVDSAFARFEASPVAEADLRRVKAGYEAAFYQGLSSVLGKAFQLAQYNIFAGSPGYITEDLERLLAVTGDDVKDAYDRYLRGQPTVATSFVPRGAVELALEGSRVAEVVEEPIIQGAEPEVVVDDRGTIARTPSAIDRSVEPEFGPSPTLSAPVVWMDSLANGLRVLGIEDREIPVVRFTLRLDGGLLADAPDRVGASNLLAEIFTEGTANRTPEELEKAIEELGASIDVSSGRETFTVQGSTLARNFSATMALLEEVLLEPRWDEEAFELARSRTTSRIRQLQAVPVGIANDVVARLLYGDHVLGRNQLGTLESVEAMTLDDLRRLHARVLSPDGAALHVVGAVTLPEVRTALAGIAAAWEAGRVELPPPPTEAPKPGVYFVDVPGASQSVLRIGTLAMAETDPDYYPATVMNYRFGGGGFASDLVQVLREQRGYTYGIGSSFQGSAIPGPFLIGSSVRANVTYESLALVKEMLERYGPTFDGEDLEVTRGFLLRSNARAFESPFSKLGILSDMSQYGFPADYVLQREAVVRNMSVERVQELAGRYFDPASMVWLVVGDARTQLGRLEGLGLGPVTRLDREGRPLG